jgi:hypothetical protein
MVGGTYKDNDGLFRKYGTTKAVPTIGGEFRSPGENRVTEFVIDLTTLTASPVIQSDVIWWPSGTNNQIEQVEVITEVAGTGGTSFSVGLVKQDRTTVLSNTAFINAMLLADVDAVGEKKILTAGSTAAGNLIGAVAGAYVGNFGTNPTEPGLITALASGTFATGRVRVRVMWHGVGTITQ